MEFRLLGPLEVLGHAGPLPLGGLKQRSLLALLLLHANETVSTDRIQAALWGDAPPATAAKALQMQVSRLRKDLGPGRLITRAPGYVLVVGPGELDLARFEARLDAARGADPPDAADALREALGLWRGSALADLSYEPFAQPHVARLQELHLTALEARIEAELAMGRHDDLVGELEGLVIEHPLRERMLGQLMLALYRSGRQSEALETYRAARRSLSQELGLEPGVELQALEGAILRHDPALEAPRPRAAGDDPCVLVFPTLLAHPDALLDLAASLARAAPARALVVTGAVPADDVGIATATLAGRIDALRARHVDARGAVFASPTPGDDAVRLAARHGAGLLLTDAVGTPLLGASADILDRAGCDVAVLVRAGGAVRPGPVVVPFGAGEHDWAALELATWAARALGAPLHLAGAASDGRRNGHDASPLLADASLIIQRQAGIAAVPVLTEPGSHGLLLLAREAGLLVVGLSDRWREEGLGRARGELAAGAPGPTVFVRRGPVPGDLTPAMARTRFGWSLTGARR